MKNDEQQRFLIEKIEKILSHEGTSAEESKIFLDILVSLPLFRKDKDLPRKFSQIITAQAGLSKDFDVKL